MLPCFILCHMYRYSSGKIHGTMYKPGCVVVRRMDDDGPEFCRLEKIVSDSNESFYFVLTVLSTPEYVPHYHAYSVKRVPSSSSQTFICKQAALSHYLPYSLHQSYDVSLRHVISHYSTTTYTVLTLPLYMIAFKISVEYMYM